MNNPVVSVICPVYNAEKVLWKCLSSIIGQDFPDIEIFLVNDGSKDGSLRVCQKYARKDPRVHIIDKPNGGRNQARKDGVLRAKGEYVFFIDDDDYLEKNAISTLVNLAKDLYLDMVAGNNDIVYDNWGLVSKKAVPFEVSDRVIGKDEWLEMLLKLDHNGKNSGGIYMWNRLYRRSCVIEAMKYDDPNMFPVSKDAVLEDMSFNLVIAPYLKGCRMSNAVIYHHRYGGATSRFFPFITKGGYYFDNRLHSCIEYHREDLLPDVLAHYGRLLIWEILGRIHFHTDSITEIKEWIDREINNREIVLWARKNKLSLVSIDENKIRNVLESILDNNVESLFHVAYQREQFLQVHYRRMKWVGYYQNITDVIGYLTDRVRKHLTIDR